MLLKMLEDQVLPLPEGDDKRTSSLYLVCHEGLLSITYGSAWDEDFCFYSFKEAKKIHNPEKGIELLKKFAGEMLDAVVTPIPYFDFPAIKYGRGTYLERYDLPKCVKEKGEECIDYVYINMKRLEELERASSIKLLWWILIFLASLEDIYEEELLGAKLSLFGYPVHIRSLSKAAKLIVERFPQKEKLKNGVLLKVSTNLALPTSSKRDQASL